MNQKSVKSGVLFAIAAYVMWGLAPMYFKALNEMAAPEIMMHRVFWSVPVLFILLLARRKLGQVIVAILAPKILKTLLVSGFLLAVNWLVFIWAINNDRLLESSLGYFINPLINVALARAFLGEKLTRLQGVAVAVVFIGVVNVLVAYGELPWVSLVLAGTFSCYGLLRKKVAVESMPGLFIESLFMFPFAIAYWIVVQPEHSNLLTNDIELNSLIVLAGVITTVPLLCFTAAARRIRYTTLGFFQYIGPSIMFVLAVGVYKEPIDSTKIFTFICVWAALIIYVYDLLRVYKQAPKI
ncbi:EamA family transporter RarD [Paraglaciecola marina]|uniref:EamA family transporter RarD n=1 Tax=Paraglaciecola marina TaxID=2500157 RepID=UPI0010621FE7|nr:EamA family transporter RarD [Paraglaciecola marina]